MIVCNRIFTPGSGAVCSYGCRNPRSGCKRLGIRPIRKPLRVPKHR